MALSYLT